MTKVEYLGACAGAVWLREILSMLFGLGLEETSISCDNQSCMKFSENCMVYDRSNHIEIRYYYIRDIVHKGAMRLLFHDERGSSCRCVYQAAIKDEV